MTLSKRRAMALLLPTLLIMAAFVLLGLWLQSATTAVDAGAPNNPPHFAGEPFTAVLATNQRLNRETIPVVGDPGTWTTVLSETFESGLNMPWVTLDSDGTTNGEYRWGTETYTNTTNGGVRSVWAVGDGENGGPLSAPTNGYPPNVDSWLIYGPMDLSSATDASFSFNYWFQADAGDGLAVSVSTDGTNYSGLQQNNGGPGGWFGASYALTSYVGSHSVYIAFVFTSDPTNNNSNKLGAFIDDVVVDVLSPVESLMPFIAYGFTPTPTPQPAVVDYFDDFDDANSGWTMRRTDDSDGWAVTYRSDDTDLEIEIDGTESFIIASPLLQGPEPPYNIETEAVIRDSQDQHAYGIIFGGDYDGTSCPNADLTSCFNHYYWLRVQLRENFGNPVLEFKLKRVDSHDADSNAIGPDLIDWTIVDGDPGLWNEWDVRVESDGGIKIYNEDVEVGRVNDDTYINDRYFGLVVSTKANGDARSKFDYFKLNPVAE